MNNLAVEMTSDLEDVQVNLETLKSIVVKQGDQGGYSFDVFVGSYFKKDPEGKYGWAFILYENGRFIRIFSAESMNKDSANSQQEEAEATFKANYWISEMGGYRSSFAVHFNFKEVVDWVSGGWEANIPLSREYLKDVKSRLTKIKFKKIVADLNA